MNDNKRNDEPLELESLSAIANDRERDPAEQAEELSKNDPLIGQDPTEDTAPVINPFPVNQDPTNFNPVINPGVIVDDEPENPDEMIRRD